MSKTQGKDSSNVGSEVMTAIRSLKTALQKERTQVGSKRGKVAVHFTETGVKDYEQGTEQGTGVIECKITISGDTADDAFELAQPYDDAGWTCTSSGETEVTCVSPE